MTGRLDGAHAGHDGPRRAGEHRAGEPAQEPTQRHTGGDRPTRPCRAAHHCPGGADNDPDERVRGLLASLAAAHAELARAYADLAADPDIQLAGSAAPRLMDGVDTATAVAEAGAPPGSSGPGPVLLTVADLARLLQVGERTVRRWRDEGRLPAAFEVGGVVRWRRKDVDRWLAEGGER